MPFDPSRVRAISLDLDDTLWPVRPVLVAAERALAEWLRANAPRCAAYLTEEVRRELRAALIAREPGLAHDMSWLRTAILKAAMQASGDDPALAEPAFQAFLAARQRVEPWEDVHRVLADWATRWPIAAVSNGNADVVRVGLGDLISVRVDARRAGCAKPDPRIFALACDELGLSPAAVLHIGDDWHLDVAAARRAGLQAAWLRRPQLARQTPDMQPTREGRQTDPPEADAVDSEPRFHDLDSIAQRLAQGL